MALWRLLTVLLLSFALIGCSSDDSGEATSPPDSDLNAEDIDDMDLDIDLGDDTGDAADVSSDDASGDIQLDAPDNAAETP